MGLSQKDEESVVRRGEDTSSLDYEAAMAIDQIRQIDSSPSHETSTSPSEPLANSTTMAPSMSLLSVNAILILNSDDGSRVFAKYYSTPHHASGPTHTQSSMPLISSLPFPSLPSQPLHPLVTNTLRRTNSTNPLPRRKITKSLRKRARREDCQANRRYHPLRQQDRAVQERERCHDVCRRRRGRE